MEPNVTELNITKDLNNKVVFLSNEYSSVRIKSLILRPILNRIIFITDEFDRIILYEGKELFDVHKDDSTETLIENLISYINSNYKK